VFNKYTVVAFDCVPEADEIILAGFFLSEPNPWDGNCIDLGGPEEKHTFIILFRTYFVLKFVF